MSFNNAYDRKRYKQEANRASEDFGDGSLLMRPEDTSIQGASEDFMDYLQNPAFDMENGAENDVIMNAAASDRVDFDALKGNGTPDLSQIAPVVAPQNIGTSMKGSMSGSSKGSSTSSDTPPTTTPQEDILSQLKAARDTNEASMLAAKRADESTNFGNTLSKSGAKFAEAMANITGTTNIKLTPSQDEAKEVEFAGNANKGKLEALMQDYGITKGIADTKYSRDKDTTDRTDRLNSRAEEMKLRREEMDYKKLNDAQAKIQAKEEVKEGIQISKENRKIRKEMDDAIPALEAQLLNIREAKEMLTDKEGGESGVATGPVDQYYSKITEKGQILEKKLNKISLDTMVKMFSGMSKAVDTNAERAQFQSTQPQMRDYQSVNIDTLKNLEKNINSIIKKTNAARNRYDRTGDFVDSEEKESVATPKGNSSYPKKLFNSKGQSATVSNAQEEAEAKSEGWN